MMVFSGRAGMSSALVLVVFAGIGVTAAGISGYVLTDPTSEISETSETSANSSQCQTWKSQTTTAGVEETDEYEQKYNNQCGGPPLDEQIENGNFLSEEYNRSDHVGRREDVSSECKIGTCRSQSVCLADGDNMGESCGVGLKCCTLEETDEIDYSDGDESDNQVNDPQLFEIALNETNTIPDTSQKIKFTTTYSNLVRKTFFRLPDSGGSSCGDKVVQASPISSFGSSSVNKCGIGADISVSSGQITLGVCNYDQGSEIATLAVFKSTVSVNDISDLCSDGNIQ